MTEEWLNLLWLESPVKLWVNWSCLKTIASLPSLWSCRLFCLICTCCTECEMLVDAQLSSQNESHVHSHCSVTVVFVGWRDGWSCSLVFVALLNGSRNPALLLSALLGRVPALPVNKLLIYVTSVKLLIFFCVHCFSQPVYRVCCPKLHLPMSCNFGSQDYKCTSPCTAVRMHLVLLTGS